MTSPFSSCNTDAEVMKKVFELAATGEYARPQLNAMAAIRRNEIAKGKKQSNLDVMKVSVPTEDVFIIDKTIMSKIHLTSSPIENNTFELIGDGSVRF